MRIKYSLPCVMMALTLGTTSPAVRNTDPQWRHVTTRPINTARQIENQIDTINARHIFAMGIDFDVVYKMNNGAHIVRTGGTRAWRNMNPGNLRYTEFSRRMGAIGTAGGFAVFPDEHTGTLALDSLLKTSKYRDLSVADAIVRYAPPHENDTAGYRADLKKLTGIDLETRMADLNSENRTKMLRAIRQIEGWRVGTEAFSDCTKIASAITANMSQNNRTI